jgi:hypothetical protein
MPINEEKRIVMPIAKERQKREYFQSKVDLFKVFVGEQEPPIGLGPRGKKMVSRYFSALKKHAKGKWQKAVKELWKAVS